MKHVYVLDSLDIAGFVGQKTGKAECGKQVSLDTLVTKYSEATCPDCKAKMDRARPTLEKLGLNLARFS